MANQSNAVSRHILYNFTTTLSTSCIDYYPHMPWKAYFGYLKFTSDISEGTDGYQTVKKVKLWMATSIHLSHIKSVFLPQKKGASEWQEAKNGGHHIWHEIYDIKYSMEKKV